MRPPITRQASQAAKETTIPQQPQPTRPATRAPSVSYPDSGRMDLNNAAAHDHLKQKHAEKQANAPPLTGKPAHAASLDAAKQRSAPVSPPPAAQPVQPQSGKERLAAFFAKSEARALDKANAPQPPRNPSHGR